MATVIDALLVTLGLDPSDYKKGEAEAAKATETTAAKVTAAQKVQAAKRKKTETEQAKQAKQLADEEKKRADATVAGLKNIALAGAGMVLGFDSIKGFITLLGNLNSNEAGLGRLGQNLGIGVHELNTWGLAAERVGGKAEDVQGAFANMSKSLTDLNTQGAVSPLILLMQRLGVATLGVTDKTKALLDVGDKLRAYGAAHGRDNAFNLAAGAGIDATTFNVITAENSRQILAEAEKANNVSEATAKQAAETQAKTKALGQRVTGIVRHVGHTLTPGAVDFASGTLDSAGDQLGALNAAAHGDFKDAWRLLKSSAGYGDRVVTDKAQLHKDIAAAEKAYGIPAGVLDQIAQNESHFRPDIIDGTVTSKTGARGLMQLQPKIFGKDVGKDTATDIDTAAREISRLAKHYGGDYVKAAEAYNFGQGNVDKGKALPKETRDYAASVAATPSLNRTAAKGTIDRSGNVTNVTVGEVTVNTQATDAAGTAAGLAGAIKRQTYTAQANTGQTQ